MVHHYLQNKEQIIILNEHLKRGTVTLVYGTKDEEHNEAVVLRDMLSSAFDKVIV